MQQVCLHEKNEIKIKIPDTIRKIQGSKVDVLGTDDVDKWQMEWRIAK